jgi:hypothetical protein
MHFATLFLFLAGTAFAGTDSLVTLSLFPNVASWGAAEPRTMFLWANKCETLNGAGGLRVAAHGDVKYNARE